MFQLLRLPPDHPHQPQGVTDFASAFALSPGARVLIVAPHDDDAVLGCGLSILAAQASGLQVHIAVVTDGRMGYGWPAERGDLVARRWQELLSSSAILGIPPERVHGLGFADGAAGRWAGIHDEAEGPRGVCRSLCAVMRQVAPGLVVVPTPSDLHPDHRVSTAEAEIACFHANAAIWLELGPPVAVPQIAHYAVYCPFAQPPTLRIEADAAAADRREAAIAAFASQPDIIAALTARLRAAGPVELLAQVPWPAYQPRDYDALFGVAP